MDKNEHCRCDLTSGRTKQYQQATTKGHKPSLPLVTSAERPQSGLLNGLGTSNPARKGLASECTFGAPAVCALMFCPLAVLVRHGGGWKVALAAGDCPEASCTNNRQMERV